MEFNVFMTVLRRRKLVFASVFLFILLLPLFLAFLKDPIYRASSSVIFKKSDPQTFLIKQLPETFSNISFFEAKDAAGNFAAILEDDANIQQTISQLGYAYELEEFYTSRPFFKFLLSSRQHALTIDELAGSELFEVSGYATSMEEAALISRKFVETAAANWSMMRKNSILTARAALEKRNLSVRQKLADVIDKKNDFTKIHGFVDYDKELEIVYNQIEKDEQEKTKIVRFLETAEIEREVIEKKLNAIGEYYETTQEQALNHVLQKAELRLAELLWELAREKTRTSEKHANVVAIYEEIEEVKKTIANESEKAFSRQVKGRNQYRDDLIQRFHDIYIDTITKQATLKVIERSIVEGMSDAGNLLTLNADYKLFNDKIALYKSFISEYETALEALSMVESMDISSFDVLHLADSALESTEAYFPNYGTIFVFGSFFAFWVSFILTLFVDYIDPSLKSRQRIESLLGLSVLTEIPYFESWERSSANRSLLEFQGHINQKSIRCILSWLKARESRRQNYIVGVTSSIFSEGVTSLSMLVASSLAGLEDKVLLVGANPIAPESNSLIGSDSTFGLHSLLEGKQQFSDCVSYVSPNLAVLALEEDKKNRFFLNSDFVQDLRTAAPEVQQFQWVIIDTPGIGEDPAAVDIVAQSDLVLFVIAPWKVTLNDVEKATDKLGTHTSTPGKISYIVNQPGSPRWRKYQQALKNG